MSQPENAGNEEQVAEARKMQRFEERTEAEEIRDILSRKSGRKLFFDLMGICGLYQDVDNDNISMWRAAGKRTIGLEIMEKVLTADPNAYTLMHEERKEFEKGND